MKHSLKLIMAGAMVVGLTSISSAAGVTVYKEGDKYVKMGGRIQLQYHNVNEETGFSSDETTDTMFFRRFRPYIEGSIHKDWKGKFQFDLGKADGENEIAIKDAYMEYAGFSGIKIKVGNANMPFSRELLTSSKKQQLVERTFVGDHNFGTPDRQLGVHLTGAALEKKFGYAFSVASASIDPDSDKLDFDTPVNKNDDFNEGWMAAGRVDFYPLGYFKMSQGDFKRDTKLAIGVAGFAWDNDNDNNTNTDADTGLDTSSGKKVDVDSVKGLEADIAFRSHGFSVDAEYNTFDAETIDTTVTAGIYKNGKTTLENYSVEGGYMLIPSKLELVGGLQVQDSDTYKAEWERTSVGFNYFVHGHDIKTQFTYRQGKNIEGVKGDDADEVFVQTQYVF